VYVLVKGTFGREGTEGAVKLFESCKGFVAVSTEEVVEPLDFVYAQPRYDAGSVSGTILSWFVKAPAGGTTAATQGGGALGDPSASPHLPVVDVGNPVTVTCLAWYGAKRVGSAIRAISTCREGRVRRAF
jgi:hypothetical protein